MPDQTDPLYQRLEKVEGDADVPETPQRVPVNMYETDSAVVLLVPLPGVMADDVSVEVGSGRVRIKAAMRAPAPKDYLLHEWHYGPYERHVDLPDGYGSGGSASFGNGQLAVRRERGAPDGELRLPVTHRG